MPYAEDTVKMTLEGTIYNVQSWSTGLWFGTSGFPVGSDYGIAQMNGLRDSGDLQGYIESFAVSMEHFWTTAVKLTQVRYAVYEGVGHTPKAESIWVLPSPYAGSGSPSLPSECAIVCSTRTNTPGPSGRGRSYSPLLSSSIAAPGGGMLLSDAQIVSDAYGALLSAINAHDFEDEVGSGFTYNLYASLASYKMGTNHPLTAVQVDTRIDSQRRREDKLPFSIATTTL